VLENRVLRRIFGAKRNGLTRERRRLHNEGLHNLCCSPDVIQMIESRRVRWVGHVARMVAKRDVYRVLVGRPEGRDHLEDLCLDGRIILK